MYICKRKFFPKKPQKTSRNYFKKSNYYCGKYFDFFRIKTINKGS